MQIYCPSGQAYNLNFECIYPANLWYVDYFLVHVGLVPLSTINVSVINNINQNGNTLQMNNLNRNTLMINGQTGNTLQMNNQNGNTCRLRNPWPPEWELNSLFYQANGSEPYSNVSKLVAVLRLRNYSNFSSVLRSVEGSITKKWRVICGNMSVQLAANFLEYSKVNVVHDQYKGPVSVPNWYAKYVRNILGETSFPAVEDRFILHPLHPASLGNGLYQGSITKLNFCRLVSLRRNISAFELTHGNTVLHYNGRTYYDGEFVVIYDKYETSAVDVRVCLSDTNYVEMTSALRSPAAMANWSFCLHVFLLCYDVILMSY